jgi:hypothetical protein
VSQESLEVIVLNRRASGHGEQFVLLTPELGHTPTALPEGKKLEEDPSQISALE